MIVAAENLMFFKVTFICVIDQACSLKMVGYWPRFFFCVFMGRGEVEVYKNEKEKKKRTGPISSHLDRTSLVNKDLLYGQKIIQRISLLQE